jgi:hypothetical protein
MDPRIASLMLSTSREDDKINFVKLNMKLSPMEVNRKMSVVLGVFNHSDKAEEALIQLEAEGYNPKDMSIVMKDRGEAHRVADNTGANVAEGALGGAGTGAVVGGIAGFLAGTVLPGLGGLLIGGPIGAALGLTGAAATTVSGAATGAVAGGLIGALMSTFGLTEEEAHEYETQISAGGILVAVPSHKGEEGEVKDILADCGADNIRIVRGEESSVRRSSHLRDRDEDFRYAGAKGGKSRWDD